MQMPYKVPGTSVHKYTYGHLLHHHAPVECSAVSVSASFCLQARFFTSVSPWSVLLVALVGVKSWKGGLEKKHVKAKAMKRKFGGVGLGFEDQTGAMQLGAWGDPMWKRDAGQWLDRRSEDAKVCVTDLIDPMTTECKKMYAGTDMEGRFLVFHDPLALWNEDEAQL